MRLVMVLAIVVMMSGCTIPEIPAKQKDLQEIFTSCPKPPETCHAAVVDYINTHGKGIAVASAGSANATGILFVAPSGEGIAIVRTLGKDVSGYEIDVQGLQTSTIERHNAKGDGTYPELDEIATFVFSTQADAKSLKPTFTLTADSVTSDPVALGNPF